MMQRTNRLPYDGIADDLGPIFSHQEANHHLDALMRTIPWQPDVVVMFGKTITTKRQVAWYGDQAFTYTYAHASKIARPWSPELLTLKQQVEAHSGETYNSCLLNLYRDGQEGMGWHCDNEKELKPGAAIASLSFGAERPFMFKHRKTQQTISLILEHGSLLVMKGATQRHWLHQLPARSSIHQPRVNLTFRTISATGAS